LPKSLNFTNVTCYVTPLYAIHFKCVLNFGEEQGTSAFENCPGR
jgi:hypothetical protein